ncbi:hypothetical protein CHLRE_12g561601v5 [Chlamydomonas reinhardtii]|uniref:Uncharacterized protein n=1 Tax=Chlamydomonas reinhardtii TaxID=3055 RepID=A0A2K3D5E7_CHLRE|nr:uncharacterized protein CHLRE_12g561601v5 [Chlamydomonas reinhardtii]PNW75762.1 hypothetical protein CHLRE_12g561601v5 [Chlamydomonas reinhardtii]
MQHCSATLPHVRPQDSTSRSWNGFRSSLGRLADRHYTSDMVLSNDGWLTATTPPTLCPATAQPGNTANKRAVEAQLRIRHGQQLVQH